METGGSSPDWRRIPWSLSHAHAFSSSYLSADDRASVSRNSADDDSADIFSPVAQLSGSDSTPLSAYVF